ncbi:hypothetical protein BKA70DRAFT_1437360 [Coprinopsis sp. MPI-PUGE-AT-0042]|nr:hypothetical protein BKA70DRAFT_1437360 [Coprinopsis sp. MPI-PUGE-AT-0042]
MDLDRNPVDPSYSRGSAQLVPEHVSGPVRSRKHIHSYRRTQQHTVHPTNRWQADNQCYESQSSHHQNHRSWTTKQRAPCTVLPPFASLANHARCPSYPSPLSVPTRQTATSLGPPLPSPFSYPDPPNAYQSLAPLTVIEVVVNVDLVYGDSRPVVQYSKIAQVSLQPGERRFALDMKVRMDEVHAPFVSNGLLLHPQLLDDQHSISFALRHDPQPTVPRAVLPSTSTIDAGSLHSSAPVRHTIASPGLPLQSPFSYPGPPYAYQPLLSTYDGTVPMGGQEEAGMVLEVVVNVDLVHGDPGPIVKYQKTIQISLDPGEWRFALDMNVHMDETHSPLVSNNVPFDAYSLPASPADSKQPLPDCESGSVSLSSAFSDA